MSSLHDELKALRFTNTVTGSTIRLDDEDIAMIEDVFLHNHWVDMMAIPEIEWAYNKTNQTVAGKPIASVLETIPVCEKHGAEACYECFGMKKKLGRPPKKLTLPEEGALARGRKGNWYTGDKK